MFLAMVLVADGAWFDADGADHRRVEMACGKMFTTKSVAAIVLRRQVVGAEQLVAEVTLPHTLFTPLLATLCTSNGVGGELPAAGTFVETFQAKGFAAAIALVEAGADLTPAGIARDQAVGAEALPRGSTDAKLGAVLLATWATNGTISTNERMTAADLFDGISA
jgi:hypothetical protein